jgi:cellulose synthase/poly-beta-1,6-N-acetylglucosamine synthase-like glycosyltransferase
MQLFLKYRKQGYNPLLKTPKPASLLYAGRFTYVLPEESLMHYITDLIGVMYLIIVFGLAIYGLNSFTTVILYLLTKKKLAKEAAPADPAEWPRVTVQLPVFNEKYTMERLLGAVTQLEYPHNLLQIQVLDDSTDDTSLLSARLVEENIALGIDIQWLHRTDRTGYKAGALEKGLESATGELIAIFDADFVPERDWLKRTVPHFQNPKLGCLQTRWGHTNREYNSLTLAQALAIDGHFVVEQTVRSRSGLFLNFNGTAGLWRRSCVQDAGGWQADTLTEDLDLSYRAQMRGWQIGYLPNVVVRAELPAYVEAFKRQQFRWAKGTFQVVRKIMPRVMAEPGIPWYVRVSAFLHLTGYFVHPLMVGLLLVTLPVGLFAPKFFQLLPLSILAMFGPPLLYAVAGTAETPSLAARLKILPLLTILGFGMSLSTSVAVIEGITGRGGEFVRTPKLNLGNDRTIKRVVDGAYIPSISSFIWGELGLGLYALMTIIILGPFTGLRIIPWMTIYCLGYFYIAGLNLIQHWHAQVQHAPVIANQQA